MIVTLAELKSHLGIPLTATQADEAHLTILELAQGACEAVCGFAFDGPTSRTDFTVGDGLVKVYRTSHVPVVSITSVVKGFTLGDATAETLTVTEDYALVNGERGEIRFTNPLTYQAGYTITYSAGPYQPDDLKAAVIHVASAYIARRGSEGMASDSAAGVSQARADDLTRDVRFVLRKHWRAHL